MVVCFQVRYFQYYGIYYLNISSYLRVVLFLQSRIFLQSGRISETHFAGEEIIFSKRLKRVLKPEGLGVFVLTDLPVCSSARKLVWHSDWSILKKILPLVGLPWLLKSRKACRFWYERPKYKRNG